MSTRPETTRRTIEPAQQTAAKVAGFTSLFALAAVVFVQFGIHARLFVEGNAAETARNIMAHEQRESRYELNQTDSEDRGRAVPGERGDWLLQHHLCPQQTDGIW